MRTQSVSELDVFVNEMRPLFGAQVQDVLGTGTDVILRLHAEGSSFFIWFDMRAACPMVLKLSQLPKFKKKSAPVALFANAHFIGAHLSHVDRDLNLGRVLQFSFQKSAALTLEFQPIPHKANLIVAADGKRVSWAKPSELSPFLKGQDLEARTSHDLLQEWQRSRPDLYTQVKKEARKEEIAEDVRPLIEATIKKLEVEIKHVASILEKVQSQVGSQKSALYREAGEWLKMNQTTVVPEEFLSVVQLDLSLSENILSLFGRAKKEEEKLDGLKIRTDELVSRLKLLENMKEEMKQCVSELADSPASKINSLLERTRALFKPESQKDRAPTAKKSSDTRARKKRIYDKWDLWIGKTGRDNLQLLREAQAWDYWLHLRDVPGCHGILKRRRDEEVPHEALVAASQWVVRYSISAARQIHEGDMFDVIVCECRFVRPIRGDRAGLVNYHHEKTLRLKFRGSDIGDT